MPTSSRRLVLLDTVQQILPNGQKIVHQPWTLVKPVRAPIKLSPSGRTLFTFEVRHSHSLLELHPSEVGPVSGIIAITKDHGEHLRFDTFEIDFLAVHPRGHIVVRSRSGQPAIFPLAIIEPTRAHARSMPVTAP